MATPTISTHQAVDPMSLILSGTAYRIWLELKHPHTPKVADIRTAFAKLSREDRAAAAANAKKLVDYGNSVLEALAR